MELCEDEIIIPAETSAHNWMDRFIKQYKYGIDEGVIVKNGKITWTGDWCEHSIYLNKDRFIIDGNEIFITAELWQKYLKMRELCGTLYVRAPRKIAFPYDWSELSDEQVQENIQYLKEHYTKYKITILDDKTVKMDNVEMCRDTKKVDGRDKICLTVNNKTYCRENPIGKEIIDLIHVCKMTKMPLKNKAKNWWKDNKDAFQMTTIITGLFLSVGLMVWYVDQGDKKTKEQLKQEIIKEALDSLRKEQQKITNYNDSVKVR